MSSERTPRPEAGTDVIGKAPADGIPAWQRRDPVTIDAVQYKAWCDDKLAAMSAEPLDVQRAAAEGVAGPAATLPHGDAIQASFGHHDVSGVQAHVGGAAAEAATAIGATAYATGSDVAFATTPDLHLSAHEAAHVIQQRGGVSLKGGVGRAGDMYEQHADAVADAVVRGDSAVPLLDQMSGATETRTQRRVVQRFGGEEHKRMGDVATGGEHLQEFADLGIDLSFGDGVMISGDVLGYLEREQPKNPNIPWRTTVDYLRDRLRNGGKEGRDEVLFAVWFARGPENRGPEPDVPAAIKERIRSRYLQLAKENINHFSHGGTARETYVSMHNQACEKAHRSTLLSQPALFEEAKTDEAFAQHYLSDMFSGGHVRMPRAELDRNERARDMPSIESIVTALAWEIFVELDAMGDFGFKAKNPIVPNIIKDKIVAMIKAKGGDALKQGSYSALVSKALHDKDNEGLDVVSKRGAYGPTPRDGHRWRSVGDGHVLGDDGRVTAEGSETYRMAVLAMSVSRRELDEAAAAGRTAFDAGFTPESINAGKALDYVPVELAGENVDLSVNTLNWDAAVDVAFRAEVLPRLITFFPDVVSESGATEATISESGMTLHVGAAMKRVAATIDKSPSEWMRNAMSIQVPNVQGDGPPDIAGPSEEPRDAGVGE